MSEWPVVKIKDLGTVLTGKTPSSQNPHHFGDYMPFVTPTDFDAYLKTVTTAERSLSIEGVNTLRNKVLPEDAILVTCIGSQMGKVVLSKVQCVTNQQINSIICNDKVADSGFVYYSMISLYPLLRRMASDGTTMPIVNKGDFENIGIPLPPLPTQRRIAEILGRLDDKIEVNRRINRTLEAMAQALFRHHFVDFDPYQAELVESEAGLIPRGWRMSCLGDLFPKDRNCVITGPFGSNLHASDYRDEGTPLILVKHVQNGQIIENDIPLVGAHKLPELRRYLLENGDIVFTRVGVVGQSAYIHDRQAGWMISGQTLRIRVPDDQVLNSRYLAQAFLDKSFVQMVEAHAVGSTRPSLNTQLLASFKFLIPPREVQDQFSQIALKLDAQVQNHRTENRKLVEIRDYLLPRLLSGQVEAF